MCVWLQENHPYVPPLVFVKPTSSMAIKPSHHVDTNGKVYLPFLHEWAYVCILNYYHCSSIKCIYRASDISRKKKQNFAGFSGANSRKIGRFRGIVVGKKSKFVEKSADFRGKLRQDTISKKQPISRDIFWQISLILINFV